MTNRDEDRLVRIGKVGRPHGVRGAIRVFVDAPDSDTLQVCKALTLRPKNGPERVFQVNKARLAQRFWIVELADCRSRGSAEALVGATVHVPRSVLPEVDEDTFYEGDLIGMTVIGPNQEPLGKVTQVFDSGAHDVLVYKAKNGPEAMVPFIGEYVEFVDLDTNTVSIRPLEFDDPDLDDPDLDDPDLDDPDLDDPDLDDPNKAPPATH